MSRATTAVADFFPWESSCLVRAVAACVMLRRRGLPGVLHCGVRLDARTRLSRRTPGSPARTWPSSVQRRRPITRPSQPSVHPTQRSANGQTTMGLYRACGLVIDSEVALAGGPPATIDETTSLTSGSVRHHRSRMGRADRRSPSGTCQAARFTLAKTMARGFSSRSRRLLSIRASPGGVASSLAGA